MLFRLKTRDLKVAYSHDPEQSFRTDIHIGAKESSTSGQNRRAKSDEQAADRDASRPSAEDGLARAD